VETEHSDAQGLADPLKADKVRAAAQAADKEFAGKLKLFKTVWEEVRREPWYRRAQHDWLFSVTVLEDNPMSIPRCSHRRDLAAAIEKVNRRVAKEELHARDRDLGLA